MLYYKFSKYLKDRYGEKVYKIPINLPLTCPNRLGGNQGCIYCSDVGAGFEMLSDRMSVKSQLEKNINYIGPRYGSKKFIAYFQNYTNTFLPVERLKEYIVDVVRDDIVGISISTRPDCISTEYLDMLKEYSLEYEKDIFIELGIQTVNYKTLEKINRGHTLAEYIDSSKMIKSYDFHLGTHFILNLPWDNMKDIIEGSKIASSLKVDSVKLHSLYILKDTELGKLYEKKDFEMDTLDDYIEKVIIFLEYLSPNISVERLLSRAPKKDTLFCNYGTSWWKIRDMIEKRMINNNIKQGDKFNYLGGKEVKRFLK